MEQDNLIERIECFEVVDIVGIVLLEELIESLECMEDNDIGLEKFIEYFENTEELDDIELLEEQFNRIIEIVVFEEYRIYY